MGNPFTDIAKFFEQAIENPISYMSDPLKLNYVDNKLDTNTYYPVMNYATQTVGQPIVQTYDETKQVIEEQWQTIKGVLIVFGGVLLISLLKK
jgi:hypothetical protein